MTSRAALNRVQSTPANFSTAEILYSAGLRAHTHSHRALRPVNLGSVQTQVTRCLERVRAKSNDLERYEYLSALRSTHTHLFYRLLIDHLYELTPLVYTPTIGAACQHFSQLFAHHDRGLYISIEDRGHVRDIINALPVQDVQVAVLTDGSRILGLGDLGANGMGIPIGKLSLYVACAGIDPAKTLPVMIDLGTNNEDYLTDPLYVGLRRRRVPDAEGEAFVTEFLDAFHARFPHAIAQFEDFHQPLCFDLLEHQRDKRPCFNDDIQWTAAVSLACFFAAVQSSGVPTRDHRFVFFGAGSAAVGIAQLMAEHLVKAGMSEDDARDAFWLVDSKGLVANNRGDKLPPHKVYFARRDPKTPRLTSLDEVVNHVKPTGLLGLSTVGGAFTPDLLKRMASFNARPIIFALSNPSSKSECTFAEAIEHTDGRAIFASGSPFPDTTHNGKTLRNNQANNVYVFPSIGLGAALARVTKLPEELMHAAAEGLAAAVSAEDQAQGLIYPPLDQIRPVTVKVARKIIRVAQGLGVDTNTKLRDLDDAALEAYIAAAMYEPTVQSIQSQAHSTHLNGHL